MVHGFAGFELDEQLRELRLDGEAVPLQPLVFELLLHLVRHRDRVLGKQELLDALWPDAIVTEASLQRAVSLARTALRNGGLDGAIRNYPRQGYRFTAPLREAEAPASEDGDARATAHRALEAGRWEEACAAFARADETALDGSDYRRWALAARWCSRLAEAGEALERSVRACTSAGDRRGAARAAIRLVKLHEERREYAVASGWLARAGSLVAEESPCRERALHLWMRARAAMWHTDYERMLALTDEVAAMGEAIDDVEVRALGLSERGHALLALERTGEGLACHDEAAARVLSGDVGPEFGGIVYCSVIWAASNRGDWGRAAAWTDRFTRWCGHHGVSSHPGLCKLHQAELLQVRGRLAEAKDALETVCRHLKDAAPWAEGDAWRILGDVHRLRGDPDSAEAAYRKAHALGWEPQPGLAFLQLAQGDGDAAVAGLRRAVDDDRWFNRERRLALRAHLVTVALAAGLAETARAGLAAIDATGLDGLTRAGLALVTRARAAWARHEGRADEAVRLLREACRHWLHEGVVLEAASERLRLAEVLREQGDDAGADLEREAAHAALREAGVDPRP